MYSILIVDDDSSYRNSIQMILRMEGFDVCTASDGQSALAMLLKNRPDLILCDIMMPAMDGYSLLEAVKENKTLVDIPFIFVTAMGSRDDVRRGMSSGADDYLSKPFSAEELLAAVIGRIRRHEMIRRHHVTPAFQKEQAILRKKITKREREVLIMVGQGNTTKAISECLGICVRTVEAHRTSLMNKLEVVNAASLARWAVIADENGF
ncbi:MAG: response regulator transcription factor [Desulfuromonadaceae bacterium]|nr:response regulator transcription factor [Desulfuromonadaceae bacterium]